MLQENENLRRELDLKHKELELRRKQLDELDAQNNSIKRQLEDVKAKNALKIYSLEKAIQEQNKANQEAMRLLQDYKREKEAALEKLHVLEMQLDAKQVMQHTGGDEDLSNMKMKEMAEQLSGKMEEMENLESLNRVLMVKERICNDELQEARNELINGFTKMSSQRTLFGIKRLGELDHKVFLGECMRRFPKDEAQEKAALFCTKWQEELKNPDWHPFKVVIIDGKPQEFINQDDEKLQAVKGELGEEVWKAVITALKEMNENNPSGRYSTPELWNFRMERKATLKEVINYVLKRLKTNKRRRQTI